MRELTDFLEWLKQFENPEEWQIYAYEGEVQAIIVTNKDRCWLEEQGKWNTYCFHNETEGVYSMTRFKGQKWKNEDDFVLREENQ